MLVVAMVAVIVVVVVVVKVLVWTEATIDMVVVVEVLVIAVLVGVEVIVVGTIVIISKSAWPVSNSVDEPSSDVAVDLTMEASTGVVMGVLPWICIGALADVNTNSFAVVVAALEFPVSKSLEEYCC